MLLSPNKSTDPNYNMCRLTTFNCKSVKRSIDNVRDICMNSDIVALQETWLLPHDIPFLGSISSDFEFTGNSAVDTSAGLLRGRPYGGVAILWRKGVFQNVSVIKCNSNRLAAIRVRSGDRFIIVFSVYMPTDSHENLPLFTEVLSEISAVMEGENIECMYALGDFNAHPHEPFYNELANFCLDQSWMMADVEKLGLQSDTYTFTSEAHGSRRWLDHCVVSMSAYQTIIDVVVGEDVYVSDHLPLHVKFNLTVIRPKSVLQSGLCNSVRWGERKEVQIKVYRNLCNERLRDIDFPLEFVECSRGQCNLAEHKLILDNMYSKIVCILGSAASETGRVCSVGNQKKKNLCGWNYHVRSAHREARLRFKIWVQSNRPSSGLIYEEMHKSRKIFKSRLKWCQNNQEQIKMDILAQHRSSNNFKKFWKETGKHDLKAGLPVSVGGKSDSLEIANMFREHFSVKSPLGPPKGLPDAGPGYCRGERSLTCFTAAQVRSAMKRMGGGRSPGHDGLSIEHLKYAGFHLPRVLSMFFTLCVSHSYLPRDLMKTTVVPIVKNKTGDISDRGNYRPISLATIIAKIFDGLLDSCLNNHLSLHDAQFGFRPGLSTECAIAGLKHTVKYYTDRRTPVYACFLDLSKAFDLVSYDMLWKKLRDRHIPDEILKIFQFWYANQTNVVKWANACSDAYRLECGVRQGGLTSPKLFNLYVNDLIVGLNSMRVGCRIDGVSINNISYADDMVLLGPTVSAIAKMLRVCEGYAAAHGLLYNAKKTEYMVFGAVGGSLDEPLAITLNGMNIKRVTKFKYLGHFLTDVLKDDVDIERERRALAVRGNMLIRRFSRCTDEVKITLFKAYCQIFYTGSLWVSYTKRSLDTLRIQYNNIFRMLMGLPRFCSASGMFACHYVDGFQAIIRKKTASLINRLRASNNGILRTLADRYTSPIWKCLVRRVI